MALAASSVPRMVKPGRECHVQNNRLLLSRPYREWSRTHATASGSPKAKRSHALFSHRFLSQKELDPDFVDFNSVNRRYHYPARAYRPMLAGFIQLDALWISGIMTTRYRYSMRPTFSVDPTGLQDLDPDLEKCIWISQEAVRFCAPFAGVRTKEGVATYAGCIAKHFQASNLDATLCAEKIYSAGEAAIKRFTNGSWTWAFEGGEKWPKAPKEPPPMDPVDPKLPKTPDDPYAGKNVAGQCCYEYVCIDVNAPTTDRPYDCKEKGKEGWRIEVTRSRWSEFHSFPCGKAVGFVTRKPNINCERTGVASEGACDPASGGVKFPYAPEVKHYKYHNPALDK
jgi:hypothetical protein